MRDYGKLYTSFWTSDDTRRLSDDGKLLAAYLLTGPHTTLIGCFRIPDGYVSEDLGWDPERVSKGFRNLSDNGFATYNKGTKWVFIHQFMKWNGIENPNQAKAAIKLYEQIPEVTGLRPHIIKAFNEFAPRINTDEMEPLGNPLQTLSKPEAETETETETETEAENPKTAFLKKLKDLLEIAKKRYPLERDIQAILVFVQANIRNKNPDAIIHCINSAIKAPDKIKSLPAYLNAALKCENGNYNARDLSVNATSIKIKTYRDSTP